MRTIPLLRSPYSTDGTPVITSMDSMFSVRIFLVSEPLGSPKEALFPTRTPSTSSAVPKAAFPADEPPSRRDSTLFTVRSGFIVFPPGRRALTSVMLDIWRCSSAVDPKVRLVFSPSFFLWAVTTTSSRARVFRSIFISMGAASFPALKGTETST